MSVKDLELTSVFVNDSQQHRPALFSTFRKVFMVTD